jgi:hypothetical protein
MESLTGRVEREERCNGGRGERLRELKLKVRVRGVKGIGRERCKGQGE